MDVDKPFTYTSIQKVRALGNFTTTPDDLILDKIREASAAINRVTGQWFQAVGLLFRTSGRGDIMLHFPGMPPVLSIDSLQAVSASVLCDITSFFVTNGRRIVRLQRSAQGSWWNADIDEDAELDFDRLIFADGGGNIQIRGTFGWLSHLTNFDASNNVVPFQTTTAGVVDGTSGSIIMASVSGITVGSSLLLGDPLESTIPVFVTGIDRPNSRVLLDPLGDFLPEALAAGTKVRCFGRVPVMLTRAATILTGDYLNQTSAGAGGTDPLTVLMRRRMLKEKTEDYQYELESPISPDTSERENTTGNTEVDSILANFVGPPGIEIV